MNQQIRIKTKRALHTEQDDKDAECIKAALTLMRVPLKATAEYKTMLLHFYAKDKKFARAWVEPIRDSEYQFNKPLGGLWTSPAFSKHSWKQWCEAEEFRTCPAEKRHILAFRGRVLTIDTVEDLKKLSWRPIIDTPEVPSRIMRPLFEPLVAQGYDAIHLTAAGEQRTRGMFTAGLPAMLTLYGWDVETVLVMDREAICEVKRQVLINGKRTAWEPVNECPAYFETFKLVNDL